MTFDAAGRVVNRTNALGVFTYAHDGSSRRVLARIFPNGQVEDRGYGDNFLDHALQRITHRSGTTPISEFIYVRNVPAKRITTWSQQTGVQPASLHSFGYDTVNQLLS